MVASCWLFLNNLYYDARIHEHQVTHGSSNRKLSGHVALYIGQNSCWQKNCVYWD